MVWIGVGALALVGVACVWIGAWRIQLKPFIAGLGLGAGALAIALAYVSRPPEKLPLDPNPSSGFRIAALGDSYISGEGAQRYFPGTDDSPKNGCHRAASAHPYRVAKELGASLAFIACSGARTYDVTGEDADGKRVGGQYPKSDDGVIGARPQVDELRALPKPPDVVLLSIGGNDAGFAEIGIDCAEPGPPDCRRSASFWLHRLETDVYPRLLGTYAAVREAARGAPVFVVTYPNPLGPAYCGDILLNRGEFGFVRDVFVKRLNQLISYAAAVSRVRVIDLTHSLDGYRFCEKPLPRAAVNFVTLGRTSGSTLLLRLESLGSLAHGTFHPNPLGHELLARTVKPAVEAARSGTLPPLPSPPSSTDPPPFAPEELSPPVGTRGFPEGTACTGDAIAFVSPLSAEKGVKEIALPDVRPGSTVCYRSYQAEWRSVRADATGAVRVPVDVRNAGVGGVNEILAQQTGGTWKKIVVSRLGAVDEFDKPDPRSRLGLWLLAGALGAAAPVALALHWTARRRRAAG
jgi:lysophospholipase L1-like esterase